MTQAQHQHLEERGYVLLPKVLRDDHLRQVQQVCYGIEEDTCAAWQRAVKTPPAFRPYGLGPYAHVVEPIVNHNDLLLDLLEFPPTLSMASRFLGPDIQMLDNALHIKPAGTPSHTKWHRDTPNAFYPMDQWDEADRVAWQKTAGDRQPFFKLKVFFFIDDIGRDNAPFCVVPGTHLAEVDTVPQYDDLEQMPDCLPMVGPAGAALVWNACLWHTALHNTGSRPRRMLLFNYAHFGMKQYDVCIPDETLALRARERSPILGQLLGLGRSESMVSS